jgi:hypothetical protein
VEDGTGRGEVGGGEREGCHGYEGRKGGQAADGEMESLSEIDGWVVAGTHGWVQIGWVRKNKCFGEKHFRSRDFFVISSFVVPFWVGLT